MSAPTPSEAAPMRHAETVEWVRLMGADTGHFVSVEACEDFANQLATQLADDIAAAREEGRQQVRSQPRSLLREPVKNIGEISKNIPGGCYCPPDRCSAPVIMGRQTACLRRQHDAALARGIDSGEAGETRGGSTPKGQEPGAREGTRPEESEIAQPSLHIEPETRNDD